MSAKIQEITNTDQAYTGACIWEYMDEVRRLAEGHEWARPMLATWKGIGTVSMRYSAMSLAPVAQSAWDCMTAAQREGYNGVDEGFDWGFIPAFVRAVVWTGNGYKPFDKAAFIKAIAGHVEAVPFKPSHPMAFEYFEVRPCIESADSSGQKSVDSYVTEEDYQEARDDLDANGTPYETFWTVYGRYNDGDAFLAEAIADRATKADAQQLMNAIIAPMAAARDLIRDGDDKEVSPGLFLTPGEQAADALDDLINQSSNMDRI